LDCVKEPSENCFNKEHKHTSPFDVVRWNYGLVKRVREAMDTIDPDTLLMTEGLHEV